MIFPDDCEMALSPAEFLRTLPAALGDAGYRVEDGLIIIGEAGAGVEIRLEPRPPRRIAGVVLPTTAVSLRFPGLSAEAADRFRLAFQRAFLRGGG